MNVDPLATVLNGNEKCLHVMMNPRTTLLKVFIRRKANKWLLQELNDILLTFQVLTLSSYDQEGQLGVVAYLQQNPSWCIFGISSEPEVSRKCLHLLLIYF